MELLLISKTRLKVILTSEEMEKYALSQDETTDGDKIKATLHRILDRDDRNMEFDLSSDGLLVQMFTSKDGGCEMYISLEKSDTNLPVPVHKTKGCQDTVFCFDGVQDLLDACRHLQKEKYIFQSKAYADSEKGRYYLVLSTAPRDAFGKNPCLFSVVWEYGRAMPHALSSCYLQEHCQCFCHEDAVFRLGELA